MDKIIESFDVYGNKYNVPISELGWRPSAYAIVVYEGKILLSKQYGTFHLPGGGVELGETPENAAIREVREETGIIISAPQLVGSISNFFTWRQRDGQPVHVQSILMYYIATFIGGELSKEGFDEVEKMVGEMPEWIPLEELDTIRAGSTVDWRQVVKNLLKNTQL